MNAPVQPPADAPDAAKASRKRDLAQFIVCAVMLAVGGFLIVDALTLSAGFAKVDPVGPQLFPLVVGSGLLVLAVGLGFAILRGSTGEADGGEDVDLDSSGDWRTVGLLVGLFVVTIALVDFLGWAIIGTVLFAGAATILGSHHWVRNIAIGAVLGFGSFYAFYVGLGIPLPAGILDGIL
ncbi:tripartite tricarboxylate transporter TctB family protein [Rhodococcus tibetensis]|uniref:Tripartite tricarboxylate transporter TctB family protein n=1 Tax=Rhodococcus tibetensis TaxID=2965064 RepID=A0ABT1QAS5_9NOCA|nr:tripartite tricarboxylate transporter TctB family protein [Rhodococcus sp. FXJ9.536]MCQ4119366.1 tripartite tricarboxylate transporter TctB family protein [Rhodococcus sp. FXJ9.536]